ncbi:TrkH family potassium uptake protein [Deltaproteobacteria bacterium TL4]
MRPIKLTHTQIFVLSFLGFILLGTLLLKLPLATTTELSFMDAAFTATSAVCVTGLIVKNTPVEFTLWGQLIILLLIQVGGLGYMSMATFLAILLGEKISLKERVRVKEFMNMAYFSEVEGFIKIMFTYVFLVEAVGAVLLTLKFLQEFSVGKAIFYGIFHSISAFNNAGFSLFPDSLIRYQGDWSLNLVIAILIILGGIGFVVVNDVYQRFLKKRQLFSIHTRLVFITTVCLLILGTVLMYFSERNYLFSQGDLNWKTKFLTAFFASVTARTAGFNTVDYSLLQAGTLFIFMGFMFIGASPGSTGGGIKTTTFSLVLVHIWCVLKGQKKTVIFNREIPQEILSKAFVILAISVLYVCTITLFVVDLEHTNFEKTLFEVVSAFSTVGLSTGDGGTNSLSALFSVPSKMIILFSMLVGRLGPLVLFMALLQQKETHIHYPQERIMIG